MYYLYGVKGGKPKQLAATFGSEQQLLAYARWATLQELEGGQAKFEQGSVLVGCQSWEMSTEPLTDDPADQVPHNPTPSML